MKLVNDAAHNYSEKLAEENLKVREIVNEILNVGVNDRMIILLMYLLSMNIEDNQIMQKTTEFLRYLKEDVFLIDKAEETNKKEEN
jgi:hypothetical protein